MAVEAPRSAPRVLNFCTGPPEDGLKRDWDICPGCGGPRWQLVLVPDRFHCDRCEKSTARNDAPPAPPEPEQMGLLGGASNEVGKQEPAPEESPPIDEAAAWMADEMPDE